MVEIKADHLSGLIEAPYQAEAPKVDSLSKLPTPGMFARIRGTKVAPAHYMTVVHDIKLKEVVPAS